MLACLQVEVEFERAVAAGVDDTASAAPLQPVAGRRGAPATRRARPGRGRACRGGRSAARGSRTASSRQVPRWAVGPAEDRDASGVGGERERVAAFDDRVAGRPAAAPDQAARLVVAAPHVTLGGRDRVGAAAADQRREQRRRSPSAGSTSRRGRHADRRSRRARRRRAARTRAACAACSATPGRSSSAYGDRDRQPRTRRRATPRLRGASSATAAGCAASPARRTGRASRPARGTGSNRLAGRFAGTGHVWDLLRVVAGASEVAVRERWREVAREDRLDGAVADPQLAAAVMRGPVDGLGRDLGLEDRRHRLWMVRHARQAPVELRAC